MEKNSETEAISVMSELSQKPGFYRIPSSYPQIKNMYLTGFFTGF